MGKESWAKSALVWTGIIILILMAMQMLKHQKMDTEVKYSDFLSRLEKDKNDPNAILRVEIKTDPSKGDIITARLANDKANIITVAPSDTKLREELREKLNSKNIPIDYLPYDESGAWIMPVLFNGIPLLLLVGIAFFFMRNMQGAGGRALSFGKSKAKMMPESSTRVTFKDVAGIEEAKQECSEIVSFLKDHKRYQDIGARIPKGILMVGPPGTGKTLLARAIAGEAGVPFFHISGSDFVEMFVGVGASRVRDLFENAKKNSPCIVFIDEIDAVGRHRGAGVGGGHDEREQTLNQLLVEMDGFEPHEAVIVLAATNRPDVLDPALLRPGRFDRRVVVDYPDSRGRKEILGVYMKKVKTTEDIDVERLAMGTPGWSGADLSNLVNEAALLAARHNQKRITMTDFEQAKDKIIMGPERKSMVLTQAELTTTAYHETGHALVAYFLKSKTYVYKLTIIPRGQALGYTAYQRKEDIHSWSREDILTQIASGLAGRAAEEIKFGHYTTGAASDIQKSTEMARAMVCQYGMSHLGPINLTKKAENPFLGRDLGESQDFSEALASEVDDEVRKILNMQYDVAKNLLLNNMDTFERVTQVLLKVETLNADEFLRVIQGATVDDILASHAARDEDARRDSNSSGSGGSESPTFTLPPLNKPQANPA